LQYKARGQNGLFEFILAYLRPSVKGGINMIRDFDIWENPILNLPEEVQDYCDEVERGGGKILDSYSFSYGTPDGEVSTVSYTVTWANGSVATVTTKEFYYDFTPEGEQFRAASKESMNDAGAVLRWAKKIIENPTMATYWDLINKQEAAS
jgi:hypothetical protein